MFIGFFLFFLLHSSQWKATTKNNEKNVQVINNLALSILK